MRKKKVIIVGAGPVGLALAYLLSQSGISTHVFEQNPSLQKDLRAFNIQPSTLDKFAQYPIIDRLLDKGIKIPEVSYWNGDTRECIARLPFSLIADHTKHPFRFHLSQYQLSKILVDYLQQDPNFEITYNSKLIGAKETAYGVQAVIQGDNEKVFDCDLLCGCDGGQSTIRRDILKIATHGHTYPERLLSFDLRDFDLSLLLPNQSGANYIIGHSFSGIALQLDNTTVRLAFNISADKETNLDELTSTSSIKKRVLSLIPEFNIDSLKLHRKAIYTVHQRVAQSFGKGKILLLGDAAHLNSPVGGLGLNTGIHDAFILADAISQYIKSDNGELLNQYPTARMQYVQKHTIKISDQNHQQIAESYDINKVLSYYQELHNNPKQAKKFLLNRTLLEN